MNGEEHSRSQLLPQHVIDAAGKIPRLCTGSDPQLNVEIFFDLLQRTRVDSHCFFRQEFWQTYLDQSLIDAAWLVFTEAMQAIATTHLDLPPTAAGRLHPHRRIEELHGVLLMRLGNLVIAEWSHVGKCRFWLRTNPNAPRLYQKGYSREQLSEGADYVQQHYFSLRGLWQKDAHLWLKEKSGVGEFLA